MRRPIAIAFCVVDHRSSFLACVTSDVADNLSGLFGSANSFACRTSSSFTYFPLIAKAIGLNTQTLGATGHGLGATPRSFSGDAGTFPDEIRDCKFFVQFTRFPARRIMPFVYFFLVI